MRIFYFNLFVSMALIVGGFFVPPLGIIDGSVLTAVGELLMFGVLAQIPKVLDAVAGGKSIKVSKGDLTISASSNAKLQDACVKKQTDGPTGS